jgi:predicted amidohydrolase
MKLAAAAFPIDWHNRWNDYVGKLRVWVRTAAEQGAELLAFPDYGALEIASLAGEDNARDAARSIDAVSARIKDVDDLHGSLAREFKVHICAASGPVRDHGTPYDRARLFAPDGTFAHQDKLTLSAFEQAWGIAPGDRPRVFETALGRLGILLTTDAEQPAIAAAMAEAGAEVLLLPSLSDGPRGYARMRTAALARAAETRCAVVHAVTLGLADWLPMASRGHGAAGIFVPPDPGLPEDGVINTGKMDSAGWVHGEVDLAALRTAREAPSAAAVAVAEVELVPLGAAPTP